ncbi:Nn.00g070330.m01.CDS01 [Neocucurbitaria sp. VM-36]
MAHMKRMWNSRAVAAQKTRSQTQPHVKPISGVTVSNVGGTANVRMRIKIADRLQNGITSRILKETEATWQKLTAAQRTREYIDQVTVTIYTSDDGSLRSTQEPYNDSERGAQVGTDPTSSIGSHGTKTKKSHELAKLLKKKNGENTALQAAVKTLEDDVCERDECHRALEERYATQRAQRLKDKETVDHAFEQYQALQVHCTGLKESNRSLEAQCGQMTVEYRAQLQAKDRQLAELRNNHECEIAVLEKAHHEELASKAVEIQEAKALLQEKDEELNQAIRDGAKERRDIKAKLGEEKRELTKAAKINRNAWSKEKESLDERIKQMDTDARDSLQAQKDEIVRLTQRKRHLEIENALLSNRNQGCQPGMEQVQEAIATLQETRKELEATQRQKTIAFEKIENILESQQQQQDRFSAEVKKEQKAQILAYELQKKVTELQEKLNLRDDVIRMLKPQTEESQRSQASDQRYLAASSDEANVVCVAILENDMICAELESAREETAGKQREIAKLDAENLGLSLSYDVIDGQLHASKEEIRLLQNAHATSEEELEFLRLAIEQQGNLTVDDKADLRQHLRELTGKNQALTKKEATLTSDLKSAHERLEVIHDKCDSEETKISKERDYWFSLYFHEAVPKTESLYEEIRALHKEQGRDVQVQERVERNVVVADRAALRTACRFTLQGVDTNLIPAEYYEPGFVGGWIEATHDALRVLRPLGWAPVSELGKVFLAPMYKPFTEKDVEYRREAQEQTARKEHRARMGYPPPEGMSTTSVSDDKRTDNETEAHNASPLRDQTTPRPSIPIRAAQKQHVPASQAVKNNHRSKSSAIVNTKAATGQLKQGTALKPKPQAAQRLAPVPTYETPRAPPYRSFWAIEYKFTREQYDELDEDVKVDWINAHIAEQDR